MTDTAIERLIPHRGRMKLVDEVISADEESATTTAVVTPHWPLVCDGFAGPLVMIELVAQTSAAALRWKEQQAPGSSDEKGWLVGIKKAEFMIDRIPVDTRILTRSNINFTVENLTEATGVLTIGKDVVGEVTLQVLREVRPSGDAAKPPRPRRIPRDPTP